MPRARHLQTPVLIPLRRERLFKIIDRLDAATDDAMRRGVDGGEREFLTQKGAQFTLGELDAEHRPFRDSLEQPPAQGHDRERVSERNHPGVARGDVLAEALAEHRFRAQPPVHQQRGQRVLRDEESGEHVARLLNPLGGGCQMLVIGIKERAQVQPKMRLQILGAAIHRLAKERLDAIEFRAHPDVLRPAAGKGEDDRTRGARMKGGEETLRVAALKSK
jgi:hypothetical protein